MESSRQLVKPLQLEDFMQMTLWTLKDAEGRERKQSDTPPQGGHTTEPETLGDQRPLRGRLRNLVWHNPHSPYQLVEPPGLQGPGLLQGPRLLGSADTDTPPKAGSWGQACLTCGCSNLMFSFS